jgi:hypothetical protein
MAQFAAISRERHGRKKWLAQGIYAFAAADAVVPIVAAELTQAALAMPCAFLQWKGHYKLVAVLSAIGGRNMFVSRDGLWLGGYIPAALRLHPFQMLPSEGSEELLLCVDEESSMVVEGNGPGEPFFGPQGEPSPSLKAVFEASLALERNRQTTDLAVAALAQAGVIRPWQIRVKAGESERPVSGLYRVDEAALHALPNDVFVGLRTAAALPIAYTQMLSTRQLGLFERLEALHSRSAQPPVAALPETLDGLLENLRGAL